MRLQDQVQFEDPVQFAERLERQPAGARPREDVGPQGAALILELRRLQHAFENDRATEPSPPSRRAPRERVRPGEPQRRRPPKRKKGGMGRVIEACLEPFGFGAAEPVRRQSEPTLSPKAAPPKAAPPKAAPSPRAAPPKAAPPSRQRSTVIDGGPIPMDLSKPGPAIPAPDRMPPPATADVPRIASPALAAEIRPGTRVGQLVERCRTGVDAGIAFVVGREDAAASGESLTSRTGLTFERELKAGLRVLIIATVVIGGWAALVPLAGAVVVPGNLVVQSNVKAIQHPTGGVVAEIAVRNGNRVKAGDLLLRLDATQAQASLQVVSKQLDEFRARSARLTAERDGLPRPEIPPEMATRMNDSAVKNLLAAEGMLFTARANGRDSQKELLRSRVAQLNEEIAGLEAQVASKVKQLELITGELTGVQELYEKRLVPLARLTALQRESARIEGERGQLISTIAETKAKIGEAQLQIVRIDQDFRTDVVKELGEAKGKEAELAERSVAARDLLDRIELRAPTSGVIHQLAAHTIGGVVRPGDTIMEVVPDSDELQIEAKLQPNDIDQVRLGQKAFTRFSAFNQRVTPELVGQVSYVSPDISRDQQTNAGYFTVRVTLPEEERRKLAGLQLVSGMPAEVFMQTGSRTMLSYLFKPITDQLQRAFVER
jgi:HlyD family secretion protein